MDENAFGRPVSPEGAPMRCATAYAKGSAKGSIGLSFAPEPLIRVSDDAFPKSNNWLLAIKVSCI
jgi:hypothetical protein